MAKNKRPVLRCAKSLSAALASPRFRKDNRLRWYVGAFDLTAFPSVPACYVFIVGGKAVYVGSTGNLNTRMRSHRNKQRGKVVQWPPASIFVKYRPSKKYGDWVMLELRLIRRLRPIGNYVMRMNGGRDNA